MRMSDWSSGVCSSDLNPRPLGTDGEKRPIARPHRQHELAIRTRPARNRKRPPRSEERRVGKSVSVRVDLGGRRIIKKKKQQQHEESINVAIEPVRDIVDIRKQAEQMVRNSGTH